MASINIKIEPFPVPTHVTLVLPMSSKRQEGLKPATSQILLRDLDDATLTTLIEEFAENVMKAARPE